MPVTLFRGRPVARVTTNWMAAARRPPLNFRRMASTSAALKLNAPSTSVWDMDFGKVVIPTNRRW